MLETNEMGRGFGNNSKISRKRGNIGVCVCVCFIFYFFGLLNPKEHLTQEFPGISLHSWWLPSVCVCVIRKMENETEEGTRKLIIINIYVFHHSNTMKISYMADDTSGNQTVFI